MNQRKPLQAAAVGLTPTMTTVSTSSGRALPTPPPRQPLASTPTSNHSTKTTPTTKRNGVSTTLKLPPTTLAALRVTCDQNGATQAEIILTAVARFHTELPALVARAQAPAEGQLFTGLRKAEPPQRLVTRFTPEDLATLDRLVAQTGAKTRSAMVTVALQAHLSL